MSFVPNDGKANKCTKCAKTVYPNEAIRAANGIYHRGCLKCTECGITLNLKSCISHESKPYCNTHVPRVGHTQVATVEMATALKAPRAAGRVQGVDKSARMSFAPGRGKPIRGAPAGGRGGAAPRGGAAAPVTSSTTTSYKPPAASSYGGPNTVKVGGGGKKCPGCNKTVYATEEIKACQASWHKGCLKCTECGITLNLKTLLSYENKPYCAVHQPKASHTQVASIQMQTAMKAPKAARMQKGIDRTARGTFAPGALKPTSDAPIVNVGGVASADVQSQHAPAINFVPPEPAPSLEYDTPNTEFSNLSVNDSSDQGGYDEGGYDQGGYDQGGYDQGGYDEGGYDEGGYDQGGYDEGGYDEGGYAEEGYAEEGGYEEGGYEEGGYEEGGYEEGGYEEGGYEGYDEGGYEEGGYDEGYYEEGYDEGYGEGYDEGGYYEEGYEEGY